MFESYHSSKGQQPPGRQLVIAGLLSGVVFLGLAWLILFVFTDRSLGTLLEHGLPLGYQLLSGGIGGAAAALCIGGIFFRTRLSSILQDYEIVQYLLRIPLTTGQALSISLTAGITEEILFRGAIQPLIGIGWTSVLFVGLHGYFKGRSWKHVLFGAAMFVLSVGLGLLYREAGLLAAMSAHAVYDFVLLMAIHRLVNSGPVAYEP